MGFISRWFGVHRAILHSWVDISVHLFYWQCSWGLSVVPSRKLRLLTCFTGNTLLLCMQCRGINPHLLVRGMSHGISRIVAGTWGIFSSYSGDGDSKLHFVQRSHVSCLVTMDTSGILTKLGRIIQTLLEVRWETKRHFLASTEILGFLPIFKKSQAPPPFEALNSRSLSRFQMMWGLQSRWGGELGFSLGSPQRIQTSLYLVRWKTSLHSSHFREIRPYF